ncbi:MAG: hypothetical protein ACRD3W_01325, partial [Terriglobales bacterium]
MALRLLRVVLIFVTIEVCCSTVVAENKGRDKMTNESHHQRQLRASLKASSNNFTTESIYDLTLHFGLKNISDKTIDPKIGATELVIDGKPLP